MACGLGRKKMSCFQDIGIRGRGYPRSSLRRARPDYTSAVFIIANLVSDCND